MASVRSIDMCPTDADRIAEYDMKLMDIDADTLGIPDTDYEARVTMPASEFSRIVRDLSNLGESVRIEVSKEGVRFASDGENANGNILLKQTDAARKKYSNYDKPEEDDEVEEVKEEDDDEGEEKKTKVKKEKVVKMEQSDEEDGGEDDGDAKDYKAKSDEDGEDEMSDDSENKKKRKKAPTAVHTSSSFSQCILD